MILASLGISRFANRVRIFLLGIVVVVLAMGLLHGALLRRAMEDIRSAFEASAEARALYLLEVQGPDRLRDQLERWHQDHSQQPRLGLRGSERSRGPVLEHQVLSPEGIVLAGPGWERGTYHVLTPAVEQSLRRAELVTLWPDDEAGADERLVVLVPVLKRDGAFLGASRFVFDAARVTASLDRYRWAFALQMVAVFFLLVLVLAFSQWLVRPLRLVERTTAGEPVAEGARDPTHFLLDTYRKMISDLQEKEEDLRRLRGEDRRRARSLAAINRAIVDSMPSGILVVGPDGRVTDTNAAALQILGRGGEVLVDRTIEDALEAWPELREAVAAGLEGRRDLPPLELRRSVEGRTRWLEADLSPLRGEEGGVVLVVSDRTELKEMERQVQRKEMLADLGELSAGVAHEFRNALGTILGYARMLERRGEGQEEARAIEEEVHALERVVRDFLRFADPTRLVLTDLDLAELLHALAGEAGREGVSVEVSGSLPVIRGDETLLRRTFRNLIRNAVESIPEGEEGGVEVHGEEREGRILVRIQDEGSGVAEEARSRLFQPFFTTKPGGTGLGLALVQKIVLSHNGEIHYRPAPGGGSIFEVSLPIQGRAAGDLAAPGAQGHGAGERSEKIEGRKG